MALLKNKLDISFYAKQMVLEDDKLSMDNLFSNFYLKM